jgi:ribosomal protein L37AE/L43A
MSNWQPAGRCLLCDGQLKRFSSRTSGMVVVKCGKCGSVWTGPATKGEDVAAAAAHDERSSTRGEVTHA